MQACSSGTKCEQQQADIDVQLQGLSSRKPSTADDDSRHVQPVAASVHVDSVYGKKQVLSGAGMRPLASAGSRGIFRRKKALARSSKQTPSDWARGSGADPEQEPAAQSKASSFIAAVRAPGDVELQTEVSEKRTAVDGKPADQLSSEACVLSAFTPINAPPLLRVLPLLLIGPCLDCYAQMK